MNMEIRDGHITARGYNFEDTESYKILQLTKVNFNSQFSAYFVFQKKLYLKVKKNTSKRLINGAMSSEKLSVSTVPLGCDCD